MVGPGSATNRPSFHAPDPGEKADSQSPSKFFVEALRLAWRDSLARARLTRSASVPLRGGNQEGSALGEDTIYYATRLRGASNEKAKRELKFRPRRLEWL